MKRPSCFIIRKNTAKKTCPHCKKKIDAIKWKFHLRSVTMIDGVNRCVGCKNHPNHHKNEVNRRNHKAQTFLSKYNLPASGNFYGSKTLNVSGI